MDLASGVFTALRTGTYFFTFTAVHGEGGSYGKPFDVEIHLNGLAMGSASNWIGDGSADDIPGTLHSTLKLMANENQSLYEKRGPD